MPTVGDEFWEIHEGALDFKRQLEDILYEKGLKKREAAKLLNVSKWSVYKYIDPHNLNNNFPAYLLSNWTRDIGPELLQYIARESGYLIVPVPRTPKDADKRSLRLITAAVKEAAEALEAFARAVEDGVVTWPEYKKFSKELDDAVAALMRLKAEAEALMNKNARNRSRAKQR